MRRSGEAGGDGRNDISSSLSLSLSLSVSSPTPLPNSPSIMPPSPSPFRDSQTQTQTQALTLIPGLPEDISALILARIPICYHQRLKPTCKSWRLFLSPASITLVSIRRHNRLLSHLLCIFPEDPSLSTPYLFDPQHLAWCPLPPMPVNPHVYGLCNFNALSIGPHIFVLGGSLFDTRSYPIDRPSPSSAAFRFDLTEWRWVRLSPMLSPRGSFACAAVPGSDQIVVAGGGSRHTMFGAAGSRMRSVEKYDIIEDRWMALEGLPRFRAGCVGFFVNKGKGKRNWVGGEEEKREFWVMGGYGESRTVSGVFPVDEYYRDAVVMTGVDDREEGGRWREVGNMWEVGERKRLGKIVVVEEDRVEPCVYMLDGHDIFRYNVGINRWVKESSVPRKASEEWSYGFISLNDELLVITHLLGLSAMETQRSRLGRRGTKLCLQVYHPGKKKWRYLISKPPLHGQMDFRTAVMCTVRM